MDQRNVPKAPLSSDSFSAAPQSSASSQGAQSDSPPRGVKTRSLSSVWQSTLQSRTTVLATLFLVTGALGLPLLWHSPVFSRFEKLLWSLLTLMYTSALIGVTWAIVYWCYQLITGALTAG